jgi:Protein of unknown function (DUF1257)
MSHFTRVQTVIYDQELLEEALRQMGYDFLSGEGLAIRGYQGSTESAQVVIRPGGHYDIGFQRQPDQSFLVCADWWGVGRGCSIRQEDFIDRLSRTYAHLAVKRQVQAQGLIIEAERVLDNGDIELVVSERL